MDIHFIFITQGCFQHFLDSIILTMRNQCCLYSSRVQSKSRKYLRETPGMTNDAPLVELGRLCKMFFGQCAQILVLIGGISGLGGEARE